MFNKIKSFIIQSYYSIRYPKARELKRKNISFDHYVELNKAWLIACNIHTVLDVGANKGQFAKLAREVFPFARIYSFEPLPNCFGELQNALAGDKNFIPFNFAVGSKESTGSFFPSYHSPSSSFLKMEDLHKEAFPYTHEGQVSQPITVTVNTLDNLLSGFVLEKNILLKIDVQGFEKEVIEGASKILEQTKVIIMEVSFSKLYHDQPLFHEVYQKIYEHHFIYHGNLAQMYHPVTSEIVQADAIFIKGN